MDKRFWISASAGLILTGCCMGSLGDIAGGAGGGGGGGGLAGGGPSVGGNGTNFNLGPGFMPDPATATGTAGGPTDASTLQPDCRGYIATTPNHVLTATGAFANLRIVVNGGNADLTLVVQGPDGRYLCNDDSDGLHPMVQGAFSAGEYRIFVGTYSAQVAGAPYRIGISELSATTPSTIGSP